MRFSDLKLSIFPLSIKIGSVEMVEFENIRIKSLKSVNARLSFFSLFKSPKEISLDIREPSIIVSSLSGLSPEVKVKKGMPFRINMINISDGDLEIKDKNLNLTLLDLDLRFILKKDKKLYKLESPHLKVRFPVQKEMRQLEGTVQGEFEQLENRIKINNLNWVTKNINISANGSLKDNNFKVSLNAQGDFAYLLDPILKNLSPKGFCYTNVQVEKNLKKLDITGTVTGSEIESNGQKFQNLRSRISWDNQNRKVLVNNTLKSNNNSIVLDIKELDQGTRITAKNPDLDKILKMLNIFDLIPCYGTVQDTVFLVKSGIISGTGKVVKNESDTPDGFNVSGDIKFNYDLKNKIINLNSENIETDSAFFSKVDCMFDTVNEKNSVNISANIKDLTDINKYTSFFAGLDFSFWNFEEGNGTVNLAYNRNGKIKSNIIKFKAFDFLVNKQKIAGLTGTINGNSQKVTGDFKVDDPDLKGEARMESTPEKLSIISETFSGESKKILHSLALNFIDMSGAITGDFSYTKLPHSVQPEIKCDFTGDFVRFIIYDFQNVSGSLKADFEKLWLTNLNFEYKKGLGSGDVFIHHQKKTFNLDGDIKGIKLSEFHQEILGDVDVLFKGEGRYPEDPVNITYNFKDTSFYKDRIFQIGGTGTFSTDFNDFSLKLGGEVIYNDSKSPVSFTFNRIDEKYKGKFDFHLDQLDLLIPWKDNEGNFTVNGEISTLEDGSIRTSGNARFQGATMNFPGFPHTLDDFQGRMEFRDGVFDLKYLRGKMGNGDVTLFGGLKIADGKMAHLNISVSGKDVTLNPMDRFTCKLNTNLKLNLENEKLMLRGGINLLSADWRREIDERVSFITSPILSPSEYNFLKLLRYDLNIVGNKNIRLENSLAKAEGELDLRLRGSMDFPRLSGFVESRSGEVIFSNREFNLIKGRLVFKNSMPIDPKIDIKAEGFIKNYRVNIDIGGTSGLYKPELTSSPPLPSQDVLALISMGELFERSNSEEIGSRVGSVGMLSMTITSELQKRAKKLLGIDLLEFKPDLSSSLIDGQSKLTIGKSFFKNFVVLYSTNMATSRKEMWYAKYLLSKNLSLIGMRNEEGKFSLEIRFRKRR